MRNAAVLKQRRPGGRLALLVLAGIGLSCAAWMVSSRAVPPSPTPPPASPALEAPPPDRLATLEYQAAFAPRDPELALHLAQAYADVNRVQDALRQFQRASQIEPNLLPARVGQGQMWQKLQRPALAVDAFKWAVARLPGNAELHLELASAYLSLRDINAALAHLHKAVKLAPENAETHRALASGYLITLTLERALIEAKRATELGPNDVRNWTMLGNVYLSSNRMDEAAQALRRALVAKPDAPSPNVLLARLLMETRPTPASAREAYGLLVRALATDPFHAEALYLLGRYYVEADDFARAAVTLRRAREVDPESTRVMLLLGQALVRAGQAEEGRKLIARALKITERTVDFRGL
ncbi:MAG TPA: tetratricopeptide repeat protein, partial [Armatimonadota bacterium]|nr:tetratricopeptide repeat protein [Armatimonadota bacterium]